MKLTEHHRELIAVLTDTLDNLTYAAKLPLPPKMHVEQLVLGIEGVRDELREIINYKDMI